MPDLYFGQDDPGFQNSRHPRRSGNRCPKCSDQLVRVRRRAIDRLLSLAVPVRRFRCSAPNCGYEFLRTTATAAAKPHAWLVKLGLPVAILAGASLVIGTLYLPSEMRTLGDAPEVTNQSATIYSVEPFPLDPGRVDENAYQFSTRGVDLGANAVFQQTAINEPPLLQHSAPATTDAFVRTPISDCAEGQCAAAGRGRTEAVSP